MRLVGGVASGTLADKYGRKLPLMLSVLWFSVFAFLSGFSTSYGMLFALRALFGIGMGGEWAAGMPLVLEHWPTRLRGLASGLLLGGWYWGYLLAAVAFQFVYPLFNNAGPRLAGDVLDRDRPGPDDAVDSAQRQGKPDLARTSAAGSRRPRATRPPRTSRRSPSCASFSAT